MAISPVDLTAHPQRPRTRWVAALLLTALVTGCNRQNIDTPRPGSPDRKGDVVATVNLLDPAEALGFYLHEWMLRFNEAALGSPSVSAEESWSAGPYHYESVMPPVPLTDFKTVAVWEVRVNPVSEASDQHMVYQAVFELWRGNPFSSVRPAEALEASATYDMRRDEARNAWVITLVSAPPDDNIVPASRVTNQAP